MENPGFLVLSVKANPELFLVRNHWKDVLRCVYSHLHNINHKDR